MVPWRDGSWGSKPVRGAVNTYANLVPCMAGAIVRGEILKQNIVKLKYRFLANRYLGILLVVNSSQQAYVVTHSRCVIKIAFGINSYSKFLWNSNLFRNKYN